MVLGSFFDSRVVFYQLQIHFSLRLNVSNYRYQLHVDLISFYEGQIITSTCFLSTLASVDMNQRALLNRPDCKLYSTFNALCVFNLHVLFQHRNICTLNFLS